jgi:formylglycine-generating enzyme required for sulfatase activity
MTPRTVGLFLWGLLAVCFLPSQVCGVEEAASATNKTERLPVAGPAAANRVYTNSLGMEFVSGPGLAVLFSIWETRVQDYAAFCEATARVASKPPFAQAPTHPVVNVSWDDTKAFCDWLTRKERQEHRLSDKEGYRLPTDSEWSAAAGIEPERGKTPEERMHTQRVWPWGCYWPPVSGDGNYGPELKVDTHPYTAPVGSFKPNGNGLYDLGGNVWEWCGDWFNEARVSMTLRGGSFNDGHPAALLTAYRFNGTMNLTSEDIGFRVVLEKATP